MDTGSAPIRPRFSHRVGSLVDSFETVIYGIAFLLLVAAAVLVVIGGVEAVVQAASHKVNTLNRLLLELGALGLLVIGIAAAIFMIRFSSRRAAPTGGADD